MMFIVEVEPESRRDKRVGALQACIGGGQLAGLLIAGVLGLSHVGDAFLLGGALLLLAMPAALAFAPDPVVKVARPSVAPPPARGGDAAPIGPQRSFHRLTWRALPGLAIVDSPGFSRPGWCPYTATNALSVMFAVAMIRDYHTLATLPTTTYAIGVGCGLLLYRVVGGWDARFGPWRVLSAGLGLRALAVAAMVALMSKFLTRIVTTGCQDVDHPGSPPI